MVMFALYSHHLPEIRKTNIMQTKLTIDNEGQVQGGENGICAIRLELFDSMRVII